MASSDRGTPLIPLSHADALEFEMTTWEDFMTPDSTHPDRPSDLGEPPSDEPAPFVPCTKGVHHKHVHMMSCYADYSPKDFHLYWQVMLLVVVFYTIPSIQFVSANVNVWGRFARSDSHDPAANENMCHYNEKCYSSIQFDFFTYHVTIPAVNNILSNLGYVMFGGVYIIIVALTPPAPRDTGLPEPKGMYYALGVSLICEGCFSGLFHSCPSMSIFQFDSTFMVVGSTYMLALMYAKRHTRIAFSAVRVLLATSAVIVANVIWVIWYDIMGRWFWALPPLFFLLVAVIVVPRVVSRDFLDTLTHKGSARSPIRKKGRMVTGVLLATLNLFFLLLCVITEPEYFYFSLGLVIFNALFYVFYYLTHKLAHGERVYWWIWALLAMSAAAILFAFRFYWMHTFDTNLSVAESKKLNEPCVLLGVWDTHDCWHGCSALSVFFLMVCVYLMDMDQRNTPRDKIHVF